MKNLLQLFLFLILMSIISMFVPGNSTESILLKIKNARSNKHSQEATTPNTSQQNTGASLATAIPSTYVCPLYLTT